MVRKSYEIHEIFGGFLLLDWHPWRELSAIALMLMELSWSVACFHFFAAPELSLTLGKSFIFLGLWIMIAYSLARGIRFLRLYENVQRAVVLAVFVVGVFTLMKMFFYPDRLIKVGTILEGINEAFKNEEQILPVEIIVITFAGYLWNRGVNLASAWIDTRYAARRFRLGALMLLALGICTVMRRVEGLTLGIVLYLFSSLLAIGAARVSSIALLRGGRTRLLGIGWLIRMTAASTGVAVIAWLFGSFATAEFGNLVVVAFDFLLRVLLILGFLIISPLVVMAMLLLLLFEGIFGTSTLFREILEQAVLVFKQVMEILIGIGSLLQGFWESLPNLPFLKSAVLWLFVVLLLMLVLRMASIRRGRSVFGDGVADAMESISDSGGMGAWFRQIIQMNVGALSERLSRLRRGGHLFSAMRIRVIYTSLMRICEELGSPRRRVQTPLEFLPTLKGLFPNHFGEIELITDAYNRVRYGELPELRRDIKKVEEAWSRVRDQAKNMRREQKSLGIET